MNLTFNLVALLNVLLAAAGLWATIPELRGRPVKLWRLGLPAFFCTMTAIIMLSGTRTPHLLEFAWVIAGLLGATVGVVAGSFVNIRTDQMWGLVQFKPAFLGTIASFAILVLALLDSGAQWLGHFTWSPTEDPAVAAALLAGFLDGRAWRMAAKAVRSPHADLNDR